MRNTFIKFTLLLFFALSATTSLQAQEQSNQQSFQEESLFYAGKVWGFVKYYHPEARLGKFDIDSSLVVLLDKVSETKNLKERNKVLSQWVASFGKITEFEKFVVKDSSQYKLFYDYSWLEDQSFDKKLSKQLIDIKNAKRTDSCYYVVLEYGYTPNFENEKPIKPDFSKSHQQLIPVLRYWNAIEYFYPYKYLTDKKWDDVLKEYIPIFLSSRNEYELNTNINLLITKTNDGHHSEFKDYTVPMNHYFKKYNVPVNLNFINGEFVVTDYLKGVNWDTNVRDCGLEIGDIIMTIDGDKINDRLQKLKKYFGISNSKVIGNYLANMTLSSNQDSMTIICNRFGDTISIKTPCIEITPDILGQKEEVGIKYLDNIIYLNFSKIHTIEELNPVFKKMHDSKGLIVDIRNYPYYGTLYPFIYYLFPKNKHVVDFSSVDLMRPGEFKLMTNNASTWFGGDNYQNYKDDIIVLADWRTGSAGETAVMHLQALANTITIGSNTMGVNGNITYIPLTNNITVSFSSIGVYYPDGGETQRVGVRIDEMVYPTPKGIKEGRDELVERAIEIIRSK